MIGHNAIALRVNIHSVILSGRLPIDCHPKVNGLSIHGWTENKMQIAGVKMKYDLSAGRFQHRNLLAIYPFSARPHWLKPGCSGAA